VNGIDYEVLLQEIGSIAAGAAYKGRDDFNHDGRINAADLSVLLNRYIGPGGSVDPKAPPYGLGFCP